MKSFIYNHIDKVTLGITLILVLWFSFRTWRQSHKTTRLGILPFFYLAPLMVMTCMLTHTIEVTYHVFETGFSGKFSLGFHLYGLFLMPLVIAEAGRRYYLGVRSFLFAPQPTRKMLLEPFGLIALILFPLLWITPLSYIMFFVFVLSLGASFLVHKRKKATVDAEMYSQHNVIVAS